MKTLVSTAFALAVAGATLTGSPSPALAGPRCGPHAHWIRGHYGWRYHHRVWIPGHCV